MLSQTYSFFDGHPVQERLIIPTVKCRKEVSHLQVFVEIRPNNMPEWQKFVKAFGYFVNILVKYHFSRTTVTE